MAEDEGRIPRGMALPRLNPDAMAEVKPPPPADEKVLVLELPEPPPSGPQGRRWWRGPVVAAALVAVLVVLGLGLVVPGLLGKSKTETTSLPAPGETTAAALTEAPTPTQSPTGKPKKTKIDKAVAMVTHTPSRTTKPEQTTTHAGSTTSATGGSKPSSTPTTPKQVWGTTVVPANSELKVGENWHTNRIKLSLTTAGDAVLTDENGKVTWSAGKTGGTMLAFQGDGNLVLYQDGTVLWATATVGHEGAKLVLQDDGNVTISDGDQYLWGAL
jgi:hypothetical protein